MVIVFEWHEIDGRYNPSAKYFPPPACGLEPFPYLLMDDGGLGIESSLLWIDKGLADVESVMNSRASSLYWGREDWGAAISAESVTVNSVYDESVKEVVPLTTFYKVLTAWKSFISARDFAGSLQRIDI